MPEFPVLGLMFTILVLVGPFLVRVVRSGGAALATIWPFRKKREPPSVPTLARMRAQYVRYFPRYSAEPGVPAPFDDRAALAAAKAGALLDVGEFGQALDLAEQAIDRDPNLASAYSNRGAAHHGLGNFEQARADFERAADLAPRNPFLRTQLGIAHRKLGVPQQARREYEMALSLASDPSMRTLIEEQMRELESTQ